MAILAKKLARLVINDGNLAGDIDKDETDEPKYMARVEIAPA